MQAVCRPRRLREGPTARPMIGMYVRVDDVRHSHAFRLRERGVIFDLALLRVDDGALAEGPTSEHVRSAASAEVVEGSKDHGFLLGSLHHRGPDRKIVLYSIYN